MLCMVTNKPVWPAASAPAHIVIHVFFCVFADVTEIKITHSLCKYVNTSATFQMFAFEVAAQDQMYLVSSETFCFLKNKCIFQQCIFASSKLCEFILFGCSQNVIVNVWQGGLSWGKVDPRGFVPLLINWFFHQISFFSHHSRKSAHFLNPIDI